MSVGYDTTAHPDGSNATLNRGNKATGADGSKGGAPPWTAIFRWACVGVMLGFPSKGILKSPNTSTRVLPSLPYVHFTDERVAIPDSDQRRAMFAVQFGGSPASAADTKNQDLTHGSIAPTVKEGKTP